MARIDLDRSRGLENLPGALFFVRGTCRFFQKHFIIGGKKRPCEERRCRQQGLFAGGRVFFAGGRVFGGKKRPCEASHAATQKHWIST